MQTLLLDSCPSLSSFLSISLLLRLPRLKGLLPPVDFALRLVCMEAPKVRSAVYRSFKYATTYQTPVDHLGNNNTTRVAEDRFRLFIHVLDAIDGPFSNVKMVPMVIGSLLLLLVQSGLILGLCNIFGPLHPYHRGLEWS